MNKKLLLMYSTHKPSIEHIVSIERRLGEGSVLVADSEADAIAKVPEVEIIFGHRYLRQVLPFAEKLRWVQSTAAGVDRLPLEEMAARKVSLTRSTLSSPTIARHVYVLIWMLVRGLHWAHRNQLAQRYEKDIPMLPEPKKALILGTGSIGCALAETLKRDGIQVFGANRSGRTPQCFDSIFTGKDWYEVLPTIDLLLIALPLTTLLVGREVLERLPCHAIVVNVGRAQTLDLGALCDLLRQHRLGGAALDVISPDAREVYSPVWETPNLILTPHNSAQSEERAAQIEAHFEQQLDRFLQSEPLLDEVTLISTGNLETRT